MTRNAVLFIIYLVIVLCISLLTVIKPENNWDVLAYTASVYSLESQDTAAVHQRTYDEVKNHLPSQAYELLITNNKYREEMFRCAGCFYQQLPFYKIRPLYVFLIYLLYKLNINIVMSVFAVSGISYFFICLLCYIWLNSIYKNKYIIFILSILLAASPYLLNAASEASPNTLSGLIVLAALYSFYKRKLHLFLGLLLLSVFSRPDNLMLLLLFSLVLFFYNGKDIIPNKIFIISIMISGVIAFFLINKWSGNYNWGVWYDHTFKERIITPASYTPQFDLIFYFKSYLKWAVLFKFSFIGVQMLILFSILYMRAVPFKEFRIHLELLVLSAAVVSIFIHYVIYPVMDDKYFAAQYLFINILFIKTLLKKFEPAKIT